MTWRDFGPHRVWAGDNLDALAALPDNSVDAVVTDPPYGLSFMGRRWDYDVPTEALWREVLRVAKPGAHLLSFGGSRTFHRMAVRVEDAGWELRDTLMWIYGSGFPKSLDVSKAIDKAAGAEREVSADAMERTKCPDLRRGDACRCAENDADGRAQGGTVHTLATEAGTDLARQWQGWGTALKPAHEPIIMARKPLDGTVAANVARWGVGGINVDGCRVETGERPLRTATPGGPALTTFGDGLHGSRAAGTTTAGRWPANVLHDGSDEVQLAFAAFGESRDGVAGKRSNGVGMFAIGGHSEWGGYGGQGTAARFFYAAKASRSERGGSMHPTVKPLALMRYLVRLVTPPGGTVLDPFTGSGTTMLAADAEGLRCIGAEREHIDDVALRWGKR